MSTSGGEAAVGDESSDDVDSDWLQDVAQEAALIAGRYLHSNFGGAQSYSQKDGYFDVVTQHDQYAEQLIRKYLAQKTPHAKIVGEELPSSGAGALSWYIDPIDGTSNFASGFPLYCVSIGVEFQGQLRAGCIFAPELNELYVTNGRRVLLNGEAVRATPVGLMHESLVVMSYPYEGQKSTPESGDGVDEILNQFRAVRRIGSAALGLAWVASGKAAAASETMAKPWDVAAGFAMVKAAGGTVWGGERVTGQPITSWREAGTYLAAGAKFPFAESGFSQFVAQREL